MTDMQVGRGRVQSELDGQRVAATERRPHRRPEQGVDLVGLVRDWPRGGLPRPVQDDHGAEGDAEEAVEAGIGGGRGRVLLKDAARLQSHVGGGDERDVKGDQADDSPDQTSEVAKDPVADDEKERNRIDPSHARNPALCFFSNAILISAITSSTSASVRVRSGLLKVKANATLLCPSGTWAPLYSSNGRAFARNSRPASLIAARSAPAATCSSTTTARSRSMAGKRGSGCARLISAASSTGSTSISIATRRPSRFAPATTLGCDPPR